MLKQGLHTVTIVPAMLKRAETFRPGTHYPHVTCGGTHAYRHVTLYHASFWRQAVGGDNIPVVPVSV